MSSINPEREARRRGQPTDPLRLFERDFRLYACCQHAGCAHRRELAIALLLRAFGRDAKLAAVAERLRCSNCGARAARIEVRYVGRWSDGR